MTREASIRESVNFRPYRDSDLRMVYSSWVRSYGGLNRDQEKWAIYEYQIELIKKAVSECEILVATPKACSDDDICGWLCYKGAVVQFMYVKKPFRNFGVGTALLKEAGIPEPYVSAYKPSTRLMDKISYAPQLQHMEMLRRYLDGSDWDQNEGRDIGSVESDVYRHFKPGI